MTEETKNMNIREKLMNIQKRLNAPKNKYNSFGGYTYRSCESILEAVKPLAYEYGCIILLDDVTYMEGDWHYIQAIATITDVVTGESISASSQAREPETKKGMDSAQVTGATSSYARKYALNGLLDIDDSKDADTDENHIEKDARSAVEKKEEPKVDARQVKQLTDLAKDVGSDINSICEWAHVQTLQDMTKRQWVAAVKHLEAKQKRGETA